MRIFSHNYRCMDTVALFLFSLLFPMLCVLTLFPSAGQALNGSPISFLSLIVLCLSGGFIFKKRRQFLFITGVLSLLVFTVLYLCRVCQYSSALGDQNICALEGKLIQDSSYSSTGSMVLNLYISDVENTYGNRASARGMVRAVANERAVLCAGTAVRLEGSFSGNLFVCNRQGGLKVTEKAFLNFFRENLILLVQKRLSGCSMGEMLILGRTENYEKLVSLASGCGCMHVLALSGMHMNIVGGGVYRSVRRLTGRKIAARVLSILSALVFLLAAGPRAPLLRSFLFFVLFFLPADERLVCAFVVQLAFFPWSVFTQGAVYGYVSVFALVVLGPYIKQTLRLILPDALAGVLGSSVAVLLLNAPLQILLTGFWYPAAIISGPLAALAVSFQMLLCLFCLAFPVSFTESLSEVSAGLIEKIFTVSSGLGPASWGAFAVMAGSLVFLIVCSRLVGWQLKGKYIES